MDILIVGAGVAGLTLTALLNRRGITPRVIEKSRQLGDAGYMLGLYPLGSNIFNGLDCYQQFVDKTINLEIYKAKTPDGKQLTSLSLKPISESYGHYQCTTRYQLLETIQQTLTSRIEFEQTISAIEHQQDHCLVTFANNEQACFDMVIGADGIHSNTRKLILNPDDVEHFDTGWGGWVWWADQNGYPLGEINEYWGQGTFFGVYPVKDKLGIIAAFPRNVVEQTQQRNKLILSSFHNLSQRHPQWFAGLPNDDEPVFFWPLQDIRAKYWHKNRVLLLGDAATAFLPTAGVGASMAMESAAVLNDVLSRANKHTVDKAIEFYIKRRKKRVEDAQNDSRKLAKMMFVENKWQTLIRNMATQYMSVKSLLNSIMKDFDTPI